MKFKHIFIFLSLVIFVAVSVAPVQAQKTTIHNRQSQIIYKPLDHFWSNSRTDNFSTATTKSKRGALTAEYRFVRTDGYIQKEPSNIEGEAIPLYLYYSNTRKDNFTTATAEGISAAKAGRYRKIRIEGYVLKTVKPEYQHLYKPLWLYYHDTRKDNFTIATLEGMRIAEAGGYRKVGIEGYVSITNRNRGSEVNFELKDSTNIPDGQYETYVKRPDLREAYNHKIVWKPRLVSSPVKKEVKVRDHRTSNKTIVKNQVIYFDEADAIFGTRTELQRKYPRLKFTGNIDQIMISKKLTDGTNLIHKTVSGNTVYATVKKGKITGFEFFDRQYRRAERKMADVVVYAVDNDTILAHSRRVNTKNYISDGSSNTIIFKDNNKTCFKCTEICHDPDGAGVDTCWTTCVVVDCSKPHNASIPGKIVKGN